MRGRRRPWWNLQRKIRQETCEGLRDDEAICRREYDESGIAYYAEAADGYHAMRVALEQLETVPGGPMRLRNLLRESDPSDVVWGAM